MSADDTKGKRGPGEFLATHGDMGDELLKMSEDTRAKMAVEAEKMKLNTMDMLATRMKMEAELELQKMKTEAWVAERLAVHKAFHEKYGGGTGAVSVNDSSTRKKRAPK